MEFVLSWKLCTFPAIVNVIYYFHHHHHHRFICLNVHCFTSLVMITVYKYSSREKVFFVSYISMLKNCLENSGVCFVCAVAALVLVVL